MQLKNFKQFGFLMLFVV